MELSTTYLGLSLKNPIVPSASPISQSIDGIRAMEDAGAAAVVMYSLFEEQINAENEALDHYLTSNEAIYAESLDFFPEIGDYNAGPEDYLDLISAAKHAVDIPVIGSLNGVSTGGWTKYAKYIEEAGADALELNIYYIPTDPTLSGADVEQMYVNVVKDVASSINIPVAVKLSPYFSATANMAAQLVDAGAKGLVLFNRFYQPDFDLAELEVGPSLSLSNSYDLRLPLRWVAILYGRVAADYAITSGIHTHEDVLKGMMAGANVTMMASALLKYGVEHIGTILQYLTTWMEENEYESIEQMRGSLSQQYVAQPAAFERANYMKTLQSWRPRPDGQGYTRIVGG